MSVEIREVKDKKSLKDFVDLPYRLYKENKFWVPPIKKDEMAALTPEKNPAFEFTKTKFWVAYKDGECVGRIGALIIQPWIEKEGKKKGRITRTEFIDNKEVSSLLFKTAEEWLKSEGMETVHGPLGFSNLDHQGVLVEGQDWLPSVFSDYHFDYYHEHFEELWYEKEVDWLEFRITFPEKLPEKSIKVANMIIKRYGLKIVLFNNKKELEPYKKKIMDLFNDAFAELFGTYPLTTEMKQFYIEKYFPVLNPKFVKVILGKEDEIYGFIIAMPSLSKAMQKAGGKLLPFGWWHIMQALKHPQEMDLVLTGVKPEYQKMGIAALLTNELWKTANNAGIQFVETTGMLENNHVAIQMWKSYEHIQHKRKRCYMKELK